MRVVAFAAVIALAGAAQAAPPAYRIVDRIAGPDGGWDYVRVDAVGNRVFVTRGNSVMAVDLKAKQASTFATGQRLHIALPVNGGKEVLLTNGGDNTAVFVDARTGKPIAAVPVGKGPDAAGFDPSTGLVLVVDHSGGEVTLIDPKRHVAVGTIAVGGTLEEIAVDGKGRAFVNVEDKNQIVALDLRARKALAHYPLTGCEGPTGIAYDAADALVISACNGATDFTDARTGKVVATVATGKGADGIAWDARRKVALVSAGGDGVLDVVAVDGGKPKLAQTLPTVRGARTIGIDQRTGDVYLPSAQYGTDANGRRAITPGSFRLLVVSP
jgi:DNA-binding beta-propeller fold protein YncE